MQQLEQRIADGERCLEAALAYLGLGWSVLPLCPPDHVGIARVNKAHAKKCSNHGKVPWISWKEMQDRLPTPAEVCSWWEKLPNNNVGLALGPVSGLLRIDVDGTAGEAALLAKSNGDLPLTLEFRSGRADGTGRGLLYRIPEGVILRTTPEAYGEKAELRFQARGAQTVLPPSRHASGGLYEWVRGHSPQDIQAAVAPSWVIAELSCPTNGKCKKGRSGIEWEEIFSGVEEGSRNDSAASFIGKLLLALADLENTSNLQVAWASIEAWNERNNPPLGDDELKTVFTSILKAESQRRRTADLARLDSFTLAQINQSADTAKAPEVNGNGEHKGLPDWHLVIIEGPPDTYLLRAPDWSASAKLAEKDGYIELSEDELKNWSTKTGIWSAALAQAKVVVPIRLKNWDRPGGQLDNLLKFATHRNGLPECRRPLYVLGYLYRFLKGLRPRIDWQIEEEAGAVARPDREFIDTEGDAFFKFVHLQKKILRDMESFSISEIMKAVSKYGKNIWMGRTRWWTVTAASTNAIGLISKEAQGITGEKE